MSDEHRTTQRLTNAQYACILGVLGAVLEFGMVMAFLAVKEWEGALASTGLLVLCIGITFVAYRVEVHGDA